MSEAIGILKTDELSQSFEVSQSISKLSTADQLYLTLKSFHL